jgi:hypothetical protein
LHESSGVQQRGFDASLWRTPTKVEHGRTTRSEMVNDLLATHDFAGWTRPQVEALLGPGDKLPPGDDRWDLVYSLGADRSFLPIDNEWLGFKFAQDGTATEYRTFVD